MPRCNLCDHPAPRRELERASRSRICKDETACYDRYNRIPVAVRMQRNLGRMEQIHGPQHWIDEFRAELAQLVARGLV